MACVKEAIVKIHSSINLGYVRNSPAPPGVDGQGDRQHKGLCTTLGCR